MPFTYRSEQWLPYPVETVFAFFANPENLLHLMPSWQKVRIARTVFVSAPPPPSSKANHSHVAAGDGSRITFSFRILPLCPIRLKWVAEIREFAWNSHFCDAQIRGPFAYWQHCHRISPETRSCIDGSLLTDEIEYELPGGFFGTIAQRILVAGQLKRTFEWRHKRTLELLRGSTESSR